MSDRSFVTGKTTSLHDMAMAIHVVPTTFKTCVLMIFLCNNNCVRHFVWEKGRPRMLVKVNYGMLLTCVLCLKVSLGEGGSIITDICCWVICR